jgi:hypothetical protein
VGAFDHLGGHAALRERTGHGQSSYACADYQYLCSRPDHYNPFGVLACTA